MCHNYIQEKDCEAVLQPKTEKFYIKKSDINTYAKEISMEVLTKEGGWYKKKMLAKEEGKMIAVPGWGYLTKNGVLSGLYENRRAIGAVLWINDPKAIIDYINKIYFKHIRPDDISWTSVHACVEGVESDDDAEDLDPDLDHQSDIVTITKKKKPYPEGTFRL